MEIRSNRESVLVDIDAIQAYRAAAFKAQSIDRLGAADESLGWLADRTGFSIAEIVGAATLSFSRAFLSALPQYETIVDYGKAFQSDFTDVHELLHRPTLPFADIMAFWETRLLLFFDDFALLDTGSRENYFPDDGREIVLSTMRQDYPQLDPFVTACERFLNDLHGYIYEIQVRRIVQADKQFSRLQAEWHDAKTHEFQRCVALLLFEEDRTWDDGIQALTDVARRLAADAALELAPDEADAIDWGLTGAGPLFVRTYENPIGWTITNAAVQNLLKEPSSRASRLNSIRDQIRTAATHVTTYSNVAATREVQRLLRDLTSESDARRHDPWNRGP